MDGYFIKRFSKHFNSSGVEMYTIKGNHFVMINSMAMLNDGCRFCNTALRDLNRISEQLTCLKNRKTCTDIHALKVHKTYSRPILMQHFPTYRKSDAACREHDAPNIELFRENWEVLSKESTDLIGRLLLPRVAFAGHSHHYCFSINRFGVEEYTVASFSWRNKVEPSFLMASFSASTYSVLKCDMLPQQHVYNIYMATATLLLGAIIWKLCKKNPGQKDEKRDYLNILQYFKLICIPLYVTSRLGFAAILILVAYLRSIYLF
ncbi:metallophosphoesterase 1 homolog [Rhagoletis pomonella]|uniref:metallophosphoesterase 1 homolog n=1 Tax=Rhagoletis pomonella TaxID=28610 RepID=UPI0017834758|nr:metallophosphoesterase 1 homolog [Rhagoletis pomonella]